MAAGHMEERPPAGDGQKKPSAGGAEETPSPRIFDLVAMGVASALMVAGGLGIGLVLDDWLHSSPLATLLGLAFGIVAAVGAVVRQVRRYL